MLYVAETTPFFSHYQSPGQYAYFSLGHLVNQPTGAVV